MINLYFHYRLYSVQMFFFYIVFRCVFENGKDVGSKLHIPV